MKKIQINTILTIIFLAFCFYNKVSAQEWKQIVPLKTRCEDLKKILGVEECKFPVSNYESESFKININFLSKGDKWNVSNDTVISAMIILKKAVKLKDFETDLKDYKVTPISDYLGLLYRDDKRGIEFETQKNKDEEYVMNIILFPVTVKKECG